MANRHLILHIGVVTPTNTVDISHQNLHKFQIREIMAVLRLYSNEYTTHSTAI